MSIRKLAQRAREDGSIRYATYAWFHAGIVPVLAVQLPTEAIPAQDFGAAADISPGSTARYARVLSADRKADLDGRLVAYGVEHSKAVLAAHAPRLVAVEGTELQDDLVHNVAEVLT